jgi:hypothetical protein
MTSRKANPDPRPLLAIVAALVVLGIGRSIPDIDTEAALEPAERAAPVALGLVAIAAALASQRMIATHRTLRSRQLTAVVSADEIDAKPDVILSFAAQLAPASEASADGSNRGASAVRIRSGAAWST